jgi:hypothetical protein
LPSYFSQLEVTPSHIYWPVYFGAKILRVARTGGAIETVADGLNSPLDVMVVGGTVYWTEKNGIWLISTSCATLPCSRHQAAVQPRFLPTPPATASSIARRAAGPIHSIYWVQRTVSGGVAQRRPSAQLAAAP